jgi:D-alanyl-lipoteichoic acid acyltransferase DltB (MBOAT superfamily)
MLFNSLEFALFLPIVFAIYWGLLNKRLKAQNFFLLLASYFFYGWWDWRFLSLIFFSSFIDYLAGNLMARNESSTKRKMLLLISIFVNIGFLGFFKYFNFFAESFSDAFTFLGKPIDVHRLNIILPVGISFYTFQTLSYSIDVYRRKIEPSSDIISFFAFVSFFPQLVAGPIERATNLLPQFYQKRHFNYSNAVDGSRRILLGLFKKIVIADNASGFVNEIFGNYEIYSGSALLLAGVFFAFQVYGDFSGYCDIAIGTSRLFGFSITENFSYPFFSRDISELWRRWHISLNTWFKDYVYIPLGGSRVGVLKKIRNIFIIFVLCGFWHGANWTFIVWGAINAFFFLPLILFGKNRQNIVIVAEGKLFATTKEYFQIGLTFMQFVFGLIIFRSESVYDAFKYIKEIFSTSIFTLPYVHTEQISVLNYLIILFLFLTLEWLQRNKNHSFQFNDGTISNYLRVPIYYLAIGVIIWFIGAPQEFIYFQF